ncbi:hypothetical protein NHX12_029020 [Muraenolepis orangiensis]|uniref:Uncharacterized protein n=1 Tax=Muraenolepis orangiensis TaxID=630683 RepID=A0A9Q0EBC9_9TELE|nr:hypothetical protein NHX12_029020 [Muraenolepis orangiensis]
MAFPRATVKKDGSGPVLPGPAWGPRAGSGPGEPQYISSLISVKAGRRCTRPIVAEDKRVSRSSVDLQCVSCTGSLPSLTGKGPDGLGPHSQALEAPSRPLGPALQRPLEPLASTGSQ